MVDLPDNAVESSRERIKSAIKNCRFEFPYGQGVTINLAPADIREELGVSAVISVTFPTRFPLMAKSHWKAR